MCRSLVNISGSSSATRTVRVFSVGSRFVRGSRLRMRAGSQGRYGSDITFLLPPTNGQDRRNSAIGKRIGCGQTSDLRRINKPSARRCAGENKEGCIDETWGGPRIVRQSEPLPKL